MAILTDIHHLSGGKSFIFKDRSVLVNQYGNAVGLEVVGLEDVMNYFEDTVTDANAAEVAPEFVAPYGMSFIPIREFFANNDEETVALIGRMKGYMNWLKDTRFCPACGSQLELSTTENALVCPACGKIHYPRISPCIIATIERGDEILLLRHRQRNQDIFACMAGFVEAGESLEHALMREAKEETGLTIGNIRYVGSQSWPFPDQLMCGFRADCVSGELKIQEDEIMEARWFRRGADIPASPRPGSISWKLIHGEFDD